MGSAVGCCRNDIVGVVYRPPGGDIAGFNEEMARVLTMMRGTDGYIMRDFNVDLLRDGTHVPTLDYTEGFMSRGFWAAAPKGTKSCRTQGDFHSSVRPFICPSPPLHQASNQASQASSPASQA